MDSIPESGRFPGVGDGNLLQYPCLENTMDRGAYRPLGHKESDITEHTGQDVKPLYANRMNNLTEMVLFLERYNLSRLNHEETENINRLITRTEIGTVIKKLSTNVQDQMPAQVNSLKLYSEKSQLLSF